MDICLIIKGTCNNLIESGIKRHNPDPKIKGYLLLDGHKIYVQAL